MTPHNKANIGDIAKTVIMPGDPLRAKYIAEQYLENARLINDVRGMLGYTGTYQGKEITVFASGMGIPSMGIYCYELYKIYNVENIIRIGSCGGYSPDANLFDVILVDQVYSNSSFAYDFTTKDSHLTSSDPSLNLVISETAMQRNQAIIKGNTVCAEFFDPYMEDAMAFMKALPQDLSIIASEMEAFALFYTAKYFNKKAACLLTIVDSPYIKQQVSAEERQTSLNGMIELALDSAIKL